LSYEDETNYKSVQKHFPEILTKVFFSSGRPVEISTPELSEASKNGDTLTFRTTKVQKFLP